MLSRLLLSTRLWDSRRLRLFISWVCMAGALPAWVLLLSFGGNEPVFSMSDIWGFGCIPAWIGEEKPEPGNDVKLLALWGSHVPEVVF